MSSALLKLVLTTVCLVSSQMAHAQSIELFNGFETADEVKNANASGTQLKVTTQSTTQGKQALHIEYQPGTEWPNAGFNAATPWDWQKWGMLVVDVTNPSQQMIEFGIGVGDAPATGDKHWVSSTTPLIPGGSVTIGLPLIPQVQDVGMDGMPSQVPNCTVLRPYGGTLDLQRIAMFTLFARTPSAPVSVIVDNIRLTSGMQLDKIVDKFGQYTGSQWPGKILQDSDMVEARLTERNDWKTNTLKERSRFGGWADGPKQKASGFFRTEKVNGKWWLVDPEGHLFFSTGITTINYNEPLDQFTRITGRENLFSWLPDANNPVDAHHTSIRGDQKFFNFYSANLERKYGADYGAEWLKSTKSRLNSWGFNTVGDFSSRPVNKIGIPYCFMMGSWGGHKRVKGGNIDIDDPFDPQFASDLAQNLKGLAADVPNDPMCIGYFVDNELSWGGSTSDHERYAVVLAVLGLNADSPAKQALIDQMRKAYPAVTDLNAKWGTHFESWGILEQPFVPSSSQETAMKEDLAALTKSFASQYYRTVRETLKAHDPNHLYLGDKYMVSRYTPEVLDAAVAYCDVVSFDIYEADVASAKWDFLKRMDKPCIIGEFHFGAPDRGMFGSGMVAVGSQSERAAAYERYMRSVAEHPAFVGSHWFQYLDEPLTARAYDRENHNVGFVSVSDSPYPEMVAAARRANAAVYKQRYSQP
jgi:hypothetical protein